MKPIIFTGDSFTFGEGLELYDSNFEKFIKKVYNENEVPFYTWPKFENITWGGSAANTRNKYKFPTLVADKLNTIFLSKPKNGGDNIESIEFVENILEVYNNNDFSCVIMNLTDMLRDDMKFGKSYLIDKYNLPFTIHTPNVMESFILSWFRWEHEKGNIPFIENRNAFSTYFKNSEFHIEHASKIQTDYKTLENFENEMHLMTYHVMIEKIKKINIPFYFIGHWSKFDQAVLERLNSSEIQTFIKDKTIPIKVDKIEYESLSKLPGRQSNYFINQEMKWTNNHHPTKYLNECISESIISFLKNKS